MPPISETSRAALSEMPSLLGAATAGCDFVTSIQQNTAKWLAHNLRLLRYATKIVIVILRSAKGLAATRGAHQSWL